MCDQLSVEPVEGWRAWHLRSTERGPLLVPIGKGRPWLPLQPANARCWRHRRHRAPEVACTCGLYAVDDPRHLRWARSPAVIGTVALWGRVVVHDIGWRAGHAYPQRVALVCHVCLSQRALTGALPTVVVQERDVLTPLCSRHLGVAVETGRRTRDVLPVEGVLAALTEGYAIEMLAPAA